VEPEDPYQCINADYISRTNSLGGVTNKKSSNGHCALGVKGCQYPNHATSFFG